MINLTINGKQVTAEEGWTLLETARYHGIHIPTLCHHEAVEPSGVCRLCVVELKDGNWSKVVISCMYPVAEGLNVETESDRVKNTRRWILEMLLSQCPGSQELKDLAAKYGVTSTRFPLNDPDEQCILCGLCVRTCAQVVGANALATVGRGVHKQIGGAYMKPSTDCVACGSCVTVCPTGAMAARLDMVRGEPKVQLSR